MTDPTPLSDVPPNSLLVIRRAANEDPEALGAYLHFVRDHVPDSVRVFVADEETRVFCLPEDVLNRAGWVRKL